MQATNKKKREKYNTKHNDAVKEMEEEARAETWTGRKMIIRSVKKRKGRKGKCPDKHDKNRT